MIEIGGYFYVSLNSIPGLVVTPLAIILSILFYLKSDKSFSLTRCLLSLLTIGACVYSAKPSCVNGECAVYAIDSSWPAWLFFIFILVAILSPKSKLINDKFSLFLEFLNNFNWHELLFTMVTGNFLGDIAATLKAAEIEKGVLGGAGVHDSLVLVPFSAAIFLYFRSYYSQQRAENSATNPNESSSNHSKSS